MVFLLALPVAARPPKGDYTAPSVAIIDNTTFISANRILMFVTNHGNFGRDLGGIFGHDYGTWYPYPVGEDTSIINGSELQNFTPNYASGLWVGAIDSATGDIRIIISEYDSEYVPGPMEGGTFLPDRGDFKVYKLYADSLADNPNQAYLALPFLFLTQFLMIMATGYFLSAVVPFLPDLSILVTLLLRMVWFLSGVFFDPQNISEAKRELFFLNPMARLINDYRGILMHQRWPEITPLLWISMISILLIISTTGFIKRHDTVYPRIVTQ